MTSRFSLTSKRLIKYLSIGLIACIYILQPYTIGSTVILGFAVLIYALYSFGRGYLTISRINALEIRVLLFGLFGFFSQYWAIDKSFARTRGITILEILMLILLLYQCFKDLFTVDELFSILKWSGYFVVVGAVIYYGLSAMITKVVENERLANEYLNANVLGMLAASTMVIALYEILYRGVAVSDGLCVLCILVIVASGSRKAIIALAFGCISIYVLLNRENNISQRIIRIIIGVFVLLLLIYIAYSFQFFSGINQRLQYLVNMLLGSGEVDHSALVRQKLIEIGFEQFRKTPFKGIGLDNPRFLVSNYLNYTYYLHNNYVELLAGTGIVGTLLFYSSYIYLIRKIISFRHSKVRSLNLVIVLMVTRLLMDYGSVSYYSKDIYISLMIYYIQIEHLKSGKANTILEAV